jgi:MFS family permease
LAPVQIFLAFAAILALRFIIRPVVLIAAPAMGLRRALVFGSVLCSLSCPVLAFIDGVGLALVSFNVVSALGQVFYCTCYHVFFSALGDAERRGSQIGLIQTLGAVAALAGPGIGGLLLTTFGPGAAFGTTFLVGLAAIVLVLRIDEPQVERAMPQGAYAAAANAVRLYFADGWIQVSLTTAWSIVMFQALGGRYDGFGGPGRITKVSPSRVVNSSVPASVMTYCDSGASCQSKKGAIGSHWQYLSFPKIPIRAIRAMRQKQLIIRRDDCHARSARDICRQPVQVATPT